MKKTLIDGKEAIAASPGFVAWPSKSGKAGQWDVHARKEGVSVIVALKPMAARWAVAQLEAGGFAPVVTRIIGCPGDGADRALANAWWQYLSQCVSSKPRAALVEANRKSLMLRGVPADCFLPLPGKNAPKVAPVAPPAPPAPKLVEPARVAESPKPAEYVSPERNPWSPQCKPQTYPTGHKRSDGPCRLVNTPPPAATPGFDTDPLKPWRQKYEEGRKGYDRADYTSTKGCWEGEWEPDNTGVSVKVSEEETDLDVEVVVKLEGALDEDGNPSTDLKATVEVNGVELSAKYHGRWGYSDLLAVRQEDGTYLVEATGTITAKLSGEAYLEVPQAIQDREQAEGLDKIAMRELVSLAMRADPRRARELARVLGGCVELAVAEVACG